MDIWSWNFRKSLECFFNIRTNSLNDLTIINSPRTIEVLQMQFWKVTCIRPPVNTKILHNFSQQKIYYIFRAIHFILRFLFVQDFIII